MNERIKQIAEQTFNKVNQAQPNAKPEQWIDAFVLELSRTLVFECSDVIREEAKKSTDESTRNALKVVAINVLDHFGL